MVDSDIGILDSDIGSSGYSLVTTGDCGHGKSCEGVTKEWRRSDGGVTHVGQVLVQM